MREDPTPLTATQRRRPHDVGDQADASASGEPQGSLAAPRARRGEINPDDTFIRTTVVSLLLSDEHWQP